MSAAILKEAPEPLPATMSAPLTAIIDRCLAKEPGDPVLPFNAFVAMIVRRVPVDL